MTRQSTASYRTPPAPPIVWLRWPKVLNDQYTIQSGSMTTIHSYTNDQQLLDLPHKDLRRARSAALSMIPTSTGAAKAIYLAIPQLQGKLDGFAMRVPTPNVSVVDLVVFVEKATSVEEVNAALKEASAGPMKGILGYSEDELVSADFRGDGALFDCGCTHDAGHRGQLREDHFLVRQRMGLLLPGTGPDPVHGCQGIVIDSFYSAEPPAILTHAETLHA